MTEKIHKNAESGRRVLVVDDEPSICWAFEQMLTDQGHHVVTASSAEEGLKIASDQMFDMVLLDVRLPGQDGISALPDFSRSVGGNPVVVMTAFGDLETAVGAVRRGAFDYLIKPFRLEDARRVCQQALDATGTVQSPPLLQRDRKTEQQIIGQSPAIQHAFRQIALVAASDLPVLITGETGTGKELVAAAIHRHSHRAQSPYMPIAPVALNEDLIESELFGHARGAFTGADQTKEGLFERAEGGTVLLDEIGDLPLSIQVKLLRLMEQGEYSPVGDVNIRRCDVRLVAATHRDLHQAVRDGAFREDLFYRLNGMHIHLPPLRERTEDIGLLCQHYLSSLGDGASPEQLTDPLIEQLQQRPWHGNVRELRNAIEHAAVIARGRKLVLDDFPSELQSSSEVPVEPQANLQNAIDRWISDQLAQGEPTDLHSAMIATWEPILLARVLQHTSGNRAAAADILKIHRGTLREKLKHYGLTD